MLICVSLPAGRNAARTYHGIKGGLSMAGERKPKSARRIVINLLITLLVGLIYFYFKLPALNLQNPGFYGMVFVLAFLYCILSVLSLGLLKEVSDGAGLWRSVRINCTVPVVICAVLIGILPSAGSAACRCCVQRGMRN